MEHSGKNSFSKASILCEQLCISFEQIEHSYNAEGYSKAYIATNKFRQDLLEFKDKFRSWCSSQTYMNKDSADSVTTSSIEELNKEITELVEQWEYVKRFSVAQDKIDNKEQFGKDLKKFSSTISKMTDSKHVRREESFEKKIFEENAAARNSGDTNVLEETKPPVPKTKPEVSPSKPTIAKKKPDVLPRKPAIPRKKPELSPKKPGLFKFRATVPEQLEGIEQRRQTTDDLETIKVKIMEAVNVKMQSEFDEEPIQVGLPHNIEKRASGELERPPSFADEETGLKKKCASAPDNVEEQSTVDGHIARKMSENTHKQVRFQDEQAGASQYEEVFNTEDAITGSSDSIERHPSVEADARMPFKTEAPEAPDTTTDMSEQDPGMKMKEMNNNDERFDRHIREEIPMTADESAGQFKIKKDITEPHGYVEAQSGGSGEIKEEPDHDEAQTRGPERIVEDADDPETGLQPHNTGTAGRNESDSSEDESSGSTFSDDSDVGLYVIQEDASTENNGTKQPHSVEYQITSLRDKRTSLEGHIQTLKSSNKDLESKLSDLKSITDTGEDVPQTFMNQSPTFDAEDTEEHVYENVSLYGLSETAENTSTQDNEVLAAIQSQNDFLRNDIKMKDSEIAKLEETNQQVREELQRAHAENAELTETLKSKEQEISAMKSSMMDMKVKVQEWKDKNTHLGQELYLLRKEQDQLQNRVSSISLTGTTGDNEPIIEKQPESHGDEELYQREPSVETAQDEVESTLQQKVNFEERF